MGLVITEVSKRQPDLCYFDPSYEGEYPEEAPFTVTELEEIYPTASKKSKEDPEYYAEAMTNTHRLQEGDRGLRALWNKIIEVSVADMKKNYANLDVDFDLWWGESTVHDAIPGMVADISLPASSSSPTAPRSIRPQTLRRSARERGSITRTRSFISRTSARNFTSSRFSGLPESAGWCLRVQSFAISVSAL